MVPRGYLHITSEGAHFEPIVNVTRLSMVGMALTAWIAFIVGKALER